MEGRERMRVREGAMRALLLTRKMIEESTKSKYINIWKEREREEQREVSTYVYVYLDVYVLLH